MISDSEQNGDDSAAAGVGNLPRWLVIGCIWAFTGYALLIATPLRIQLVLLLQFALLPLIYFGSGRVAAATRAKLAIACVSVLVSAVAMDTIWGVRQQLSAPEDVRDREGDRDFWVGEVIPRKFFPTSRDFQIHKPNVVVRSLHHGEAYQVDGQLLLKIPAAREALQKKWIEYAIDEEGFRGSVPMPEAEVFVLGDSYTFGNHVNEPEIWHQVLASALGTPIYNLGVTDTSPGQHLKLMAHLFETKADRFRPKKLLWMLFEGNDLEDRDIEARPARERVTAAFVAKTLPIGKLLFDLPASVRDTSVVHGLMYGSLNLRSAVNDELEHQVVDGFPLATRVYESSRYGPRIFSFPRYIVRSTRSREYVLEHKHRPRLEAALRAVGELGRKHGFSITIVLAPSAPRVYSRFYDMPQATETPHFLDYLEGAAREAGFPVINLLPVFETWADRELLYVTDDSHWTVKGHAIVAAHVAEKLGEAF